LPELLLWTLTNSWLYCHMTPSSHWLCHCHRVHCHHQCTHVDTVIISVQSCTLSSSVYNCVHCHHQCTHVTSYLWHMQQIRDMLSTVTDVVFFVLCIYIISSPFTAVSIVYFATCQYYHRLLLPTLHKLNVQNAECQVWNGAIYIIHNYLYTVAYSQECIILQKYSTHYISTKDN